MQMPLQMQIPSWQATMTGVAWCPLSPHYSQVTFYPSAYSPGEGNGTPLQYSCLENPMDGGAW